MLHDLFLVPLTSLLLVSATPAEVCKSTPQFEVYPVFPRIGEDNSLRSADVFSEDAWGILKLEHLDLETKLSFQAEYQGYMDKNVLCQRIAKATVVFRVDATLQMKNPYPPNSCEAKQIRLHAQKHIQTAQDFQKQTVGVVESFLTKAFHDNGAIKVVDGNNEVALRELQKRLTVQLFSYSKFLNHEFDKLQDQIVDSPEEMKKIFAACPDHKPPEAEEE